MVGALIVEGDFAGVPEIARARERVLVLGQVVFDPFPMVDDFDTLLPEEATRFLTRGTGSRATASSSRGWAPSSRC